MLFLARLFYNHLLSANTYHLYMEIIMKASNLLALFISSSLVLLSACSSEDEGTTVTPFDWTISESNADNIVKEAFALQNFDTDLSLNLTSNPDTNLKSAQNKFITTPSPLPCEKSGTLNFDVTGDFFSGNFTWVITLAACDNGDGEGPATGSVTIDSSADSLTNDTSSTIAFNLTSQGATVTGDISVSVSGETGSQTSGFNLAINSATGSLSVVTNQSFVTDFGALYPSSGQMTITGPNNGKILVTVVDTNEVTIEVDADGNGTYEFGETKLWTAL